MQLESNNSTSSRVAKFVIIGLAVHLGGFTLGYVGEGLVLQGIIGIDTGIASLTPIGDMMYALGLIIVIVSAGRALVSFKYLLIAGAVIGIGLFYKSAPHEIHIASGIGFGLPHPAHIGIGAIMITISVATIAVLTLRQRRFLLQNT